MSGERVSPGVRRQMVLRAGRQHNHSLRRRGAAEGGGGHGVGRDAAGAGRWRGGADGSCVQRGEGSWVIKLLEAAGVGTP